MIANAALGLLLLAVFTDTLLLYFKNGIRCQRHINDMFSNGDNNPVTLEIHNQYPFNAAIEIVEELPAQFQIRDWKMLLNLKPQSDSENTYHLRPVQRGEYHFGNTLVWVSGPLKLSGRKYVFETGKLVKVYPSILQMKKYAHMAASNLQSYMGLNKIRRHGQSTEFDHIKEYVQGDDYRTLNWRAMARRNVPMVNTFVIEKSQQIYCLIDKGRRMKMPFEGMTLLDYAVNASLSLTQAALRNHDKPGLVTFSNITATFVPASSKSAQLQIVLEQLYRVDTNFLESDFEMVYAQLRNRVKQRSLLILFTNFESLYSLQRQLPYLKLMSRYHLLLVVFFENREIKNLSEQPSHDTEQIYVKVIAQKFLHEKKQMDMELKKHGILTLFTTPEALTSGIIAKYLEIKTRSII